MQKAEVINIMEIIEIIQLIQMGAFILISLGIGILASAYIAHRKIFKNEIPFSAAIPMLKDYFLYRIREKVSDTLETGKITNNNGTTTVTYFKGEDKYKIIMPTKRGLKPIKSITLKSIYDGISLSDDEELLKRIIEYAGPSRDFHGISVTPLLLGVNQPIIVTYQNKQIKEYGITDFISVKLPEKTGI